MAKASTKPLSSVPDEGEVDSLDVFRPAPEAPVIAQPRVTVGMHDFTLMCKALAPHIDNDTPTIRLQFAAEQVVMFTGGPYGLVAGKVDTREFEGLTGDPDADMILIPAATAAKIVTLFKPTKVEGSPNPEEELELLVDPIQANVRANSEEFESARKEQRPLHEEKLTPPAHLQVTDVSGMIDGDRFIGTTVAYDQVIAHVPKSLSLMSTRTPKPLTSPAFGLSGKAMAAYAKTSALLEYRVLLHGGAGESTLNASIGPDFRGIIPAPGLADDEAELEAKYRQVWMDLIEETTS